MANWDYKIKVRLSLYCAFTIMKSLLCRMLMRVSGLTCRDILQWWPDHRFVFSVLSGFAGNTFCVMATSAANERLCSIDDDVVNSRRANLKEFFSKRHTFFNSALRNQRLNLTRFHFFTYSVFQDFRWFWNDPLNKFPLVMKHVAWVFLWFSVTSAGLGRKQCWAGWEGLRGGSGLDVCGCGARAGNKFQPAQDSSGHQVWQLETC